jgi:hypothetical protein
MPDAFDTEHALLDHFLAAIAYRTQKALRGAPEVRSDRLGPDQAAPARPDAVWSERTA